MEKQMVKKQSIIKGRLLCILGAWEKYHFFVNSNIMK